MKTRKAAVAALISTYKDNYNSEPIQADTQKARKGYRPRNAQRRNAGYGLWA